MKATRDADLQALLKTGATGLEPATSGVTGRFAGHDDPTTIDRNRLLMRLCGLSTNRFRMIERSRFQTFAARVLPGRSAADCHWLCPLGSRKARSSTRGATKSLACG